MDRDVVERLLCAAEKCRDDEHAIVSIIDELERCAQTEDTPDLWYACGYAWYLHPHRLTRGDVSSRVDERLRRVLDVLPEDYLSLLYLGHNSYDHESYSEAGSYFERAKPVAPKSYIGLKSYEMSACCGIMAKGLGGAVSALKALVLEAGSESYAREDIWPRELAAALQRRSSAGSMTLQEVEVAEQLADRLDALGDLSGWIGGLVRRLTQGQ